MGLDLLLGLLFKALPYLAAIAAAVGGYLFIKHKGVKQERERQELEQAKAREEVRGQVDEAVRKDQEIDRRVAEETKPEPPPAPPAKPGDPFKFVVPLFFAAFLASCTPTGSLVPVPVDIPPQPILAPCPPKPNTEGIVSDTQAGQVVTMPLAQAIALRLWIAKTEDCHNDRETILRGHLEKLENRLKAISQPSR